MKLSKSLFALVVSAMFVANASAVAPGAVVFSEDFSGIAGGTTTAYSNAKRFAGGTSFTTDSPYTWSVTGSGSGGLWAMTDSSAVGALATESSKGSVSDDANWINIVGSAANTYINGMSVSLGVLDAGSYAVTFNVLNSSLNTSGTVKLTASAGSSSADFSSLATGWSNVTFTFTSNGVAATTLAFTPFDSSIVALGIDDVNVTAVPEPGTTALFLAGLAGLGLVKRRRAQK